MSTRGLVQRIGWTAVGLAVTGVVRFAARWIAEFQGGEQALAIVTAALSFAVLLTTFGTTGMSAGLIKITSQLRAAGRPESGDVFAKWSSRPAALTTVGAAAVGLTWSFFEPSLSAASLDIKLATVGLIAAFSWYSLGKAHAYGRQAIRTYGIAEVAGAVLFIAVVAAGWSSASPLWHPMPKRRTTRSLTRWMTRREGDSRSIRSAV